MANRTESGSLAFRSRRSTTISQLELRNFHLKWILGMTQGEAKERAGALSVNRGKNSGNKSSSLLYGSGSRHHRQKDINAPSIPGGCKRIAEVVPCKQRVAHLAQIDSNVTNIS